MVLYCHANYWNCTPTVRVATAPPSLCTCLVVPIRHVHHGGVRICSAGVQKHCSRQSDLVSDVHCHARFWNRTPIVQGAKGSPNLHTKAVRAPVRQRKSASCTDPYSGCTKIPFASEFSPCGGVLPCTFSELYTYCMRCHGTAQFVHTACGTRMART